MEAFVTDHRRDLMTRVLAQRTRHITLVFEDIDKPHNVSAVLRTAECLGIQDVHFIKNRNEYEINPEITQGATKWLTPHYHDKAEGNENTDHAFKQLRADGYKIYATAVHADSIPITDLDTSEKTAIVFGCEADGITDHVAANADGLVHIPMVGFTESFNLSVSAAIILNTFLKDFSANWSLSEEEQIELRAEWYRKSVREADLILKRMESKK